MTNPFIDVALRPIRRVIAPHSIFIIRDENKISLQLMPMNAVLGHSGTHPFSVSLITLKNHI